MNDHASTQRVMRTKAEAKASYDAMSGWYDWMSAGSERKFKLIGLQKLGLQGRGEAVLEIGYGTGECILKLAQSVGPAGKVYGIDLSDGMRRVAQKRVDQSGMAERVALTCGDAVSLPYQADSFDAIFISFTLELFDTPEIPLVLAECRRVLRAGGRICVVSLAQKEPRNLMARLYEWAHERFPKAVDCRPIDVCRALIEAGFQIESATEMSMFASAGGYRVGSGVKEIHHGWAASTSNEMMEEQTVKPDDRAEKAQLYLKTLCAVKPNRRTGSAGNRDATDFFANTIRKYGYEIDAAPFACLDYNTGGAILTHAGETFEVSVSPYSLGCDVCAELTVAATLEELERSVCEAKILLLRGEICSEQLMPKNFVFYNPEHHQKIIALLESRKPGGIITATEKKPEQVGALYPFPLIVDGDFDIPSAYCRDTVGDRLAKFRGDTFWLKIDAARIPSSATNICARRNTGAKKKIVVTAHIDAYEDTPGASDNASGVVVLLLLAEMLADYRGENMIEILALNGEDHYSVGGQMDYLRRYGEEFPSILFVVNIDDVGYKDGRSGYSFYECTPQLEQRVEAVFHRFGGLVRGEQWFNGDHMIFVQSQVPSIAFTAEYMPELMRTVTHTSSDTPEIIDCQKLVEVAASLNELVRSF